jgi:hypothetical protein
MGTLCFIPLLFIIFIRKQKKIFGSTLFLTILIYSYNLFFIQKAASQNRISINTFSSKLITFFNYLSGGLFHNLNNFLIPAVLFLVLIFIIWKNYDKSKINLFNLLFLFYSLSTGILISSGRSEWSDKIGLLSRYSTFSISAYIAIFFIILSLKDFKIKKIIVFSLLTIFFVSSFFYLIHGTIAARNIYNSRNFYHNLLVDENYGLQKIDYRFYFWDKNIIQKYIANHKIKE